MEDINKKYSVVIIGCGSIGALKPDKYDHPGGENILTHAHAFWKHDRISKINFIDQDERKAKEAAAKWEGSWTFIDDLPYMKNSNMTPDIIVLAVPTRLHKHYLKWIISEIKPKLVICEKPFCENSEESKEIIQLYATHDIQLAVNYQRIFESRFLKMQTAITEGAIKVESIIIRYGRGLRLDGCHGLMYVRGLFTGLLENIKFSVMITRHVINDSPSDKDASVSFLLDVIDNEGKIIPIVFLAHDSKKYNMFEIEVITDQGIFSYPMNGTKEIFRPVGLEKDYGSYPAIGAMQHHCDTTLNQSLYRAVQHYVDVLDGEETLCCPGFVAHENQVIIDKILYGGQNNG